MLGSAKRTVYTIIGINVGVWMLWQLPHARSKAFMMRHFTHHPGSGRSYTMLTCMFSHESFMHLLFNMYALSGFAPVLQDRGFQGSTEQFVAFYLSTGMLSSLGSHLVGTYRAMSNHVLKPSLGASGAVWAVVAGCAAIAPHMPVGIIFLPGLSFTMGELLPVLLGIDLVGLLRGWEVFDHAAHLAGAISGWLYITYGRDWWDRCQRELDRSRYKLG
ncbi:hypothetical protein BC832DRAFT_531793 [Gaertneriomyces semiglobifer]|nr:hypothetical protein BC832DRAFT_531793 [Gaertneriomyces semiglobifer]